MSSVARRMGGKGEALNLRCESATHSFADDIAFFLKVKGNRSQIDHFHMNETWVWSVPIISFMAC